MTSQGFTDEGVWSAIDREMKARAAAALKVLRPPEAQVYDCRFAIISEIFYLDQQLAESKEKALPRTKGVKNAADALARAIRRLEIVAADFQAEEPREDFFYIEPGGKHWSPFVKIDPLPLDALRRIRAQAEALAARKSDKPKPDASDKKRAALAARELAYEFSVGGLTAKEVAVLAAILYGDRHPDASSFLRYAKSTKPGSR